MTDVLGHGQGGELAARADSTSTVDRREATPGKKFNLDKSVSTRIGHWSRRTFSVCLQDRTSYKIWALSVSIWIQHRQIFGALSVSTRIDAPPRYAGVLVTFWNIPFV